MSDTLYLKLNQNTEVHEKEVFLSQVGKLWCSNKNVENKCKAIKLMNIHADGRQRYVVSVMKVIELIGQTDQTIQVNNVGETDFIIDYQPNPHTAKWWDWTKTLFVCLVTFFGAAFAIMTFNNDGSVSEILTNIYEMVTGTVPQGATSIDIAYSIGLPIGVIVFFNHFTKKAFSKDPTPIEVQMRSYEKDVNTTLIQNSGREESGIDVS